MDARRKVDEAATENAELQIGREQSGEVLPSFARHRCVWWHDAMKADAETGKSPVLRLRRKSSR